MNVGEQIKRYRELNDLTQTELAEKLGVSRQAVSSWEINRTEPNIGMIEKMASIFQCRKTDLIGGDDIDYLVTSTPQERFVLEKYRLADMETRKMVERILSYAEKLNED